MSQPNVQPVLWTGFLFGHAALGSNELHVLDLNDQSDLPLEEQVTNVCTKKRGVVTERSPPKPRHLGVAISLHANHAQGNHRKH